MAPSSGLFISRIRKSAPATDSAEIPSTVMTVACRGVNRPKLQKSMLSQKLSMTMNVVGNERCFLSDKATLLGGGFFQLTGAAGD